MKSRLNWKWGLLSAVILAFITSLPQIYLSYVRGSNWNGSCAYLDTDELPYVAYTNALIDGRPRHNDPYTGKDGSPHETLFSIQFLPAYALALPARILGLSASTAFILVLPVVTIASALMIWWLLFEITKKNLVACVGAVCVLSLSTAAAHSPLHIFQGVVTGYDFFPILRRYIPALPFPVLLATSFFIWRALTRKLAWAALAGLGFTILIYSYFFLWTATVAWFLTLAVLWFIARPNDRIRVFWVSGILGAMGAVALAPYAWLLSNRANVTDSGQLLEFTRSPDLFRAPELYGALVLCVIAYHVRKGKSHLNPEILFAASFALAPFLVFNQQILTGRSLQPFHYEEFVANYWVVLAAFLALGTLRREIPKRIIVYLAVGGFGISVMLGVLAARATLRSNVRFDQVRAVALKVRQENRAGLIFAPDFQLTNSISAITRNPVLWSRHMYTFSNVDQIGQKNRYYQHLYYSGFDEGRLMRALNTDFFTRWEVFGADRANPMLTSHHNPITQEEIERAAREYAAFTSSYNASLAADPLLSYAIASPSSDLSNLDRWYERSEVDRGNEFVIYRLTLKFSH